MMCCNECPFNPVTGYAEERCRRPICRQSETRCKSGFCASQVGGRCLLDFYVVRKLYHGDHLAEKLVFASLKSAILGRDRSLVLAIFQSARETLQPLLWRWLEVYEPRSLWLLNPVFSSAGLSPLDTFNDLEPKREKYLKAIMHNPCSIRQVRATCGL